MFGLQLSTIYKDHVILFLLLHVFYYPSCESKTIKGVLNSGEAQRDSGQYLTAFSFHGETAMISYALNETGATIPKLYLFLNEDWKEATLDTSCQSKFDKARIAYELTNKTGNLTVANFYYPKIWHIVYADAHTCDLTKPPSPIETPNYILYHIKLLNPDSLSAPTIHFSDEELGLLGFYQLLTLCYFVVGCVLWPRLWQTLSKGGPMQLVIQLLTTSTALQAFASFLMMVHLLRYAKDGFGFPFAELLAEFVDVVSQFTMLYMLLCLSLGWTLTSPYKSSPIETIKKNPAAKFVGLLCVLQSLLYIWEQYLDKEHRMYYAHRTYAGIALVFVRIMLAGIFAWNLRATVNSERSALKREFYATFTKSCMLWFLCYPVLVISSWLLTEYLRYKVLTMGVVLCQSAAVIILYQLFMSRSLYWEVSALSSSLPLRIDKHFTLKIHS
ncbi:integral membrane protein GPR180-like [Argonauta hians]